MDISLREWLVIIGLLIIACVVIDGFRRIRRARQESLEVSQSMGGGYENTPIDEDFNPELPEGNFRVVRPGVDTVSEDDKSEPEASVDSSVTSRPKESEFVSKETVTHEDNRLGSVVESHVVESHVVESHIVESHVEESFTAAEPPSADYRQDTQELFTAVDADDDSAVEDDSILTADIEEAPRRTVRAPADNAHTYKVSSVDHFKDRFLKKISSHDTEDNDSSDRKATAHSSPPEEVIVINVLSKEEDGFNGKELRRLVEACGMQLGQMSVFHRHEHDFDSGPIQFSMANAVEPGTFNSKSMDDSHTPGVCLFLQLPGPENSIQAFDYMVETAQCLVRNLGGELKDENRSVMTKQTIEHCRQQIREYERRRLSARV